MQTEYTSELRELKVSELDEVSGGNPAAAAVLFLVGGAVLGSLTGKIIDGVLEETGITKPVVSVKNGKVTLWGKTLN